MVNVQIQKNKQTNKQLIHPVFSLKFVNWDEEKEIRLQLENESILTRRTNFFLQQTLQGVDARGL